MSISAPSVGTQAFYAPLVALLQNSIDQFSNSVEKLASGNRIIQVSDDVAAYAISSRLQSQSNLLTQASSNVAQGSSLLQVASGGLTQISSLLNNLQSIAAQASGSALTSTQRGFLQQQFSTYLSEIDNIASSTSFNNVSLLNGTLAGGAPVQTANAMSTPASAEITFGSNPTAGNIILNGVTLTAGVNFTVGGDTETTLANLANSLNASTNRSLSQATYTANGISLTITNKVGGTLGDQYTIDQHDSTAAFTTIGGFTNSTDIYTLTGGKDNGVGIGSTIATGTSGSTIVSAQSQIPANVMLTLTGAVTTSDSLQFDNGKGGNITFSFVNTAPASSTQIQIGNSQEQTLQNIVSAVTKYSNSNTGHDNYGLRQLQFSVAGNVLTASNRTAGNPTELDGATPLTINTGIANSTLSATSLNNGSSSGGVNTSGIANSHFTGTISGFTASYVGSNSVTASVNVGGSVYTGAITNTLAGATTVRFNSTDGGYFDVALSGSGVAVGNPSQANSYATDLSSAFSGLTFYQQRSVNSFSPPDSLSGATASLQLKNFAGVAPNTTTQLSDITVLAPSYPGADGSISATIDGDTFTAAAGLGGSIAPYQSITLTDTNDPNQTLTITNGGTAQDLSTTDNAMTLKTALETAFGVSSSGTGTNFQVGAGSGDGNQINVSIGNVSSYALFGGTLPNVSNVANASAAETAITAASNRVQTISSYVGALETSFNAAANNLASSIGGINNATSNLVDTDIVSESSKLAKNALTVNAGIAVLAQAFTLSPNLLMLIHSAQRT